MKKETAPMGEERRNLYRILHVQPEAPLEVIRASYRTLMSTLRAHPDLGGDPDAAARINAAYAILTDPERRRAYDASLARPRKAAPGTASPPPKAAAARAYASSAPAAAPAAARPTTAADPAAWLADGVCPFCRHALPPSLHMDTRCDACHSPLFRRPQVERGELFGRRRSPRNARPMAVTLRLAGQGGDQPARLRDLSLSGLCVLSPSAAAPRSAMRVVTANFDAVAVVVSSRRTQEGWLLHGELLTLQLLRSQGVFVSAKV